MLVTGVIHAEKILKRMFAAKNGVCYNALVFSMINYGVITHVQATTNG